jgi:imidazolonepropionase-like amidohydrolase
LRKTLLDTQHMQFVAGWKNMTNTNHRAAQRIARIAALLSLTFASAPTAIASAPIDAQARGRRAVELPPATEAPRLLITAGRVMTADGDDHRPGYVIIADGRIEAVGAGLPDTSENLPTYHFAEGTITPGLIDTHSHLGVYPSPWAKAHSDGNEATSPTTPGVWAEHSLWPQDPGFQRALAGGVTTMQILPGSANLIGGRGVVIQNVPTRGSRAMRFPGAPETVKMACGENPKRVYGNRGGAPSTRMGNLRGQRQAFLDAEAYVRSWKDYNDKVDAQSADLPAAIARKIEKKGLDADTYEASAWDRFRFGKRAFEPNKYSDRPDDEQHEPPQPPDRNLDLETLAGVLKGEILPQIHCYRADDMLSMLQVSDEFGFQVRSFHHALEAYKIRDLLAQKGVAASTWADWWGFKLEAYDGIPANAALLSDAGVRAIIHSDSGIDIQRLNQEAAKAYHTGLEAGLEISEDEALRWITANAAWALGIEEQTGTLKAGKRADLVVWDGHPFSVYTRAEWVFVNGRLRHNAATPGARWSDFEVGQEDGL